jgi:hypothetical protein
VTSDFLKAAEVLGKVNGQASERELRLSLDALTSASELRQGGVPR